MFFTSDIISEREFQKKKNQRTTCGYGFLLRDRYWSRQHA